MTQPLAVEREELLARIQRVEAENAAMHADLRKGNFKKISENPLAIAALVMVLLLGVVVGRFMSKTGDRAATYSKGIF